MGRVIRGLSKNARFVAVDTTDIVQEAMEIHHCNLLAADSFGRLLTVASLMENSLKGEDILTLRTDTNGQIKNILVTADSNGNVKGYLSNNTPDVSDTPLLGEGMLKVIKDFGLKDPYIGFCQMSSHGLAYDLSGYFYTSEQIPTVIAFTVLFRDEHTVEKAGGYMMQLLPNAEESFLEALEQKVGAIRSIDELFHGGMDLEDIIALLYDDMNSEEKRVVEEYEILEEKEIQYHCNCDRDKFYRALITLGKEEIDKILQEDGKLEAECHFCGKHYEFREEDFKHEKN